MHKLRVTLSPSKQNRNRATKKPFLFSFIVKQKGIVSATTSGKWNDVDSSDKDAS